MLRSEREGKTEKAVTDYRRPRDETATATWGGGLDTGPNKHFPKQGDISGRRGEIKFVV